MPKELHFEWSSVRCKACNSTLKPKDGKTLKNWEIMIFVAKHMASCSQYFEVRNTPIIEDK